MTVSPTAPLVLGLDAATPPASVALVRGHELLASTTGPFGPQTDAWILQGVDSVLEYAGVALERVDRIASSIGPGTFTGIRVGIATASGLARGTGAITAGITTLEALVEATRAGGDRQGEAVLALIDARRGQLYAALSADNEPATAAMTFTWGPELLTPTELLERIGDRRPLACGSGTTAYEAVAAATRPFETAPLAIAVARLAAAATADRLPALKPFYIRQADTTPGPSPLREMAKRAAENNVGASTRDPD